MPVYRQVEMMNCSNSESFGKLFAKCFFELNDKR